jgi:hypothetical protein
MLSEFLELLRGLGPILLLVFLLWRASNKPWGHLLPGRFGGFAIDVLTALALEFGIWIIAGMPDQPDRPSRVVCLRDDRQTEGRSRGDSFARPPCQVPTTGRDPVGMTLAL